MTAKYKIGCIIEQALGHVAYGQNLKKNTFLDSEIETLWSFPQQPISGLNALPGIRNWTLQAGMQANRAIGNFIAEGNKPDVLFFHTQVTAILARRWMQQIPSVVSLDATPIQYDKLGEFYEHQSGPAALENLKFKLNKACYDRAKHLVTWSSWTKESLINDYQIDSEKITVIYPGVNVDEWTSAKPISSEAENNTQPVRILFVGGNLKRKGGYDLIKAFRLAQKGLEEFPAELHVVTQDKADSGNGVFVYNNMRANTPELRSLYEQADLFCLPTYGDCLPMVLTEAAASSLPLISTDIAAIPERILSGKSGLLVRPGDIGGIKDALIHLVNNPAERKLMGQNALEQTEQHFNAETNALRLFDLLKKVAKSKS